MYVWMLTEYYNRSKKGLPSASVKDDDEFDNMSLYRKLICLTNDTLVNLIATTTTQHRLTADQEDKTTIEYSCIHHHVFASLYRVHSSHSLSETCPKISWFHLVVHQSVSRGLVTNLLGIQSFLTWKCKPNTLANTLQLLKEEVWYRQTLNDNRVQCIPN